MTTPIDIDAAEKREPTLSAAQRIAEIHPPVGVMVLTDAAGQQRAVGCWVADRCPEWVAAIDRIIMAERASEIADARAEAIKGTLSELRTLRAELLRVRTTGHGAAHELDNIAVEAGLGHSPEAGKVAEYVRKLLADNAKLAEAVRVLGLATEAARTLCVRIASEGGHGFPVHAECGRCMDAIDKALSHPTARAALNGEAPIDSDGAKPECQERG